MKLDDVKAFIDRAELAKNARYLLRWFSREASPTRWTGVPMHRDFASRVVQPRLT